MYQILCDGYPLLDYRDNDCILVNPKVKLVTNKVCEASFTIYNNHPYYDKLNYLTSIVEISDEIGVLFRGRITEDTVDFDNGKAVDVEGALAYFNDSMVRPFTFPKSFEHNSEYIDASRNGNVIRFFLKWLIDNHNEQVQDFQKFKLGNVTVTDPNNYLYRSSTGYNNTWETLRSKLFESSLGGFLCIRYEADGNYIDYLSEFESTNTQEIVFGENMMDIKNTSNVAATYSAIIPLGAEIEYLVAQDPVPGGDVDFDVSGTVTEKLTIKGLSDRSISSDIVKRGDTLYSKKAVQECGWIYAPTDDTTWDDVHDNDILLERGLSWLQEHGMMLSNTIEATAVDLHFSDEAIKSFRMYKNVNVHSDPHGVVGTYPLSELEIDLLNPQNTKIIVGEARVTLLDKQRSQSGNLTFRSERLVTMVDSKQLYYLSTSQSSTTGGTWSTDIPTKTENTYIWTKNAVLYSDRSTFETQPTCVTGGKGDTGVGVASITTEFYLSTSKTTQSGGSWVSVMPQWSEGNYLWTRSVVTYTNGSTSRTAPICDSSWEAVNNLKAYGLGSATYFTADKINDQICPGWYRTNDISIDGTVYSYVYMRVDAYNNTGGMQTLHILSNPVVTLQRQKHAGEWQSWEWVNPPMEDGVEYRTTERFHGKPVYRKRQVAHMAAFGNASGVGEASFVYDILNFNEPVRCEVSTGTQRMPYISTSGGLTAVALYGASGVTLRTLNMTWTERDWIVDIAYTKT